MKAPRSNEMVNFTIRAGILIPTYGRFKSTLTLEDVIGIRDRRLEFQKGVSYPVLIVSPHTIRFAPAAIRYLKGEEGLKGITAAAILLDNWALMKLTRLFLRKNNPIPIQIFFKKMDAVHWLRQQCGMDGAGADLSGSSLVLSEAGENLTGTERKVAMLITEGMSSRKIADLLFMEKRTVDKHRQNINKKAGVHNVAGLLRWLTNHKN